MRRPAARASVESVPEQVAGSYSKSVSQSYDVVDADVALSPFQSAHVVPMQPGVLRELLL